MFSPVFEIFIAILFMEIHNISKIAILSKILRKPQEGNPQVNHQRHEF